MSDEAAAREAQVQADLAAYGPCPECGGHRAKTVMPDGSEFLSCEQGHGLPEELQP